MDNLTKKYFTVDYKSKTMIHKDSNVYLNFTKDGDVSHRDIIALMVERKLIDGYRFQNIDVLTDYCVDLPETFHCGGHINKMTNEIMAGMINHSTAKYPMDIIYLDYNMFKENGRTEIKVMDYVDFVDLVNDYKEMIQDIYHKKVFDILGE